MKNWNSLVILPISCLVLLQLSCKDEAGRVGPCVHIYEEPVLHIASARNLRTGAYLNTIVLSLVSIDSIRQDPFLLAAESRSVAVLDSSLVCNPPCAFGTTEGLYSFRVSASGCADTIITCSPFYSVNTPGCPSSSNGGLRINLGLPSQ